MPLFFFAADTLLLRRALMLRMLPYDAYAAVFFTLLPPLPPCFSPYFAAMIRAAAYVTPLHDMPLRRHAMIDAAFATP